VLGVGDRNWAATYQRVPTMIDDMLATAGGRRLLARAEADAGGDLAGAVRRFTEQLRQVLLVEYGDPESSAAEPVEDTGYQVTELTGAPLDPLAQRHGLVAMAVAATGTLTKLDHPLGRTKRLVRLALPADVTYRTGDHLAVLPVNDPALVDRAVKLLGADPDSLLSIRAARPGRGALPIDRPLTVWELLSNHLELQDPATAEQIARLADLNPCPPERQALKELGPSAESVLDLVERFPALTGQLDWRTVLELLPAVRIRHYSISTSPAVSPGRIDLMVSLLDAPHRGGSGSYRGTGSGYLHRVALGDTVLARIAPCREAFRVREDVPAILVAAGTGLAPFRGAIADRRVRLAAGKRLTPALCYFGCDHPDVDYLYADELRAADHAGAISMRPAFSRVPGQDRGYVQDRIAAEGDEVWQLLTEGAVVYVCGDASAMAPGVRDAFERLHGKHTGAPPAVSAEWLATLMAAGRYVEDIYAGD
jgi:cytochrome P450 / NADPH-cytochrome P450 reductase